MLDLKRCHTSEFTKFFPGKIWDEITLGEIGVCMEVWKNPSQNALHCETAEGMDVWGRATPQEVPSGHSQNEAAYREGLCVANH